MLVHSAAVSGRSTVALTLLVCQPSPKPSGDCWSSSSPDGLATGLVIISDTAQSLASSVSHASHMVRLGWAWQTPRPCVDNLKSYPALT